MVLHYAEGGNLHQWLNENYHDINWSHIIEGLLTIIRGLKEIHQKNFVHHDFHAGNILSNFISLYYRDLFRISDMGLCSEVNNTDETNVFGVMPYVAPEVLGEGRPYTQAADIYSFGMIMYLMATGRQPFNNRAHDESLILDICEDGIRPEINELEAPECYIDLMKRCWDSNPDNRPDAIEICKTLHLFWNSYNVEKITYDDEEEQYSDEEEEEQMSDNEKELMHEALKSLQYSYYNDQSKWKEQYSDDENIDTDDEIEEQYDSDDKNEEKYIIEMQFKKADEHKESKRKEKSHSITHPQAMYTSRLLNSFSRVLSLKSNFSECNIDNDRN
jgi:serine/threonine protein kinase